MSFCPQATARIIVDEFLANMNNSKLRSWLDEQWKSASHNSPDDYEIDRLVNSNIVALRYALLTQLLGKIANQSRDILAIQSGDGSGWDARSFAKDVVVPWVIDNRNILGTSRDPYVGKPLRRERLDSKAALRNTVLWNELVAFLRPLNNASREELEEAVKRCLSSIARRGRSQDVAIVFPQRVSLERLCEMTVDFIGKPSGGLRPMAICVALMQVIGKSMGLFDRVESQGINEADGPSNAVGDITCYKDNVIALVVEVKDMSITLADCSHTVTQARGSDVANVLFVVPGISDRHENTIKRFKDKVWREGRNMYSTDIVSIMQHVFMLLDEKWRVDLLQRIAKELELRGRYEDRMEWSEQCVAS